MPPRLEHQRDLHSHGAAVRVAAQQIRPLALHPDHILCTAQHSCMKTGGRDTREQKQHSVMSVDSCGILHSVDGVGTLSAACCDVDRPQPLSQSQHDLSTEQNTCVALGELRDVQRVVFLQHVDGLVAPRQVSAEAEVRALRVRYAGCRQEQRPYRRRTPAHQGN